MADESNVADLTLNILKDIQARVAKLEGMPERLALLEGVPARVVDLADRTASVERRLEKLAKQVLEGDKRVVRLHRDMLREFSRMAGRFEAQDDLLAAHHEDHDERLSQLENRLDALEREVHKGG